MSRKRSEEMFPIVASYVEGAEDVSSLCARYGLTKGQFYYWHRKYHQWKADTDGERGFIPMEIMDDTDGYYMEIQMPGGTVLRSSNLLPARYIRSLMEAGC